MSSSTAKRETRNAKRKTRTRDREHRPIQSNPIRTGDTEDDSDDREDSKEGGRGKRLFRILLRLLRKPALIGAPHLSPSKTLETPLVSTPGPGKSQATPPISRLFASLLASSSKHQPIPNFKIQITRRWQCTNERNERSPHRTLLGLQWARSGLVGCTGGAASV